VANKDKDILWIWMAMLFGIGFVEKRDKMENLCKEDEMGRNPVD